MPRHSVFDSLLKSAILACARLFRRDMISAPERSGRRRETYYEIRS